MRWGGSGGRILLLFAGPFILVQFSSVQSCCWFLVCDTVPMKHKPEWLTEG